MKIWTSVVLLFLTTTTADALQQCVYSSLGDMECTYEKIENRADWEVICTKPDGAVIVYSGIGVCSSQSSGTQSYQNTISEDAPISSTTSKNKYCWCKMLSPLPSFWVQRTYYESGNSACLRGCGWNCANGIVYETGFGPAMFGTISYALEQQ